MDDREESILRAMVGPDGCVQDVLYSELQAKGLVGDLWLDDAFDRLRHRGTIIAVFPEASPGDSGRQFWTLAHTKECPQ